MRHSPPPPRSPAHPRIRLALPSSRVDLASFSIDSTSISSRPLRRGVGGGFEGGPGGGAVPCKPLTNSISSRILAPDFSHHFCWGKKVPRIRNENAAQRASFGAGYPVDVHADIPADVRGQKLRSGPVNPGKNEHFGADIHDPKARTSTTRGG